VRYGTKKPPLNAKVERGFTGTSGASDTGAVTSLAVRSATRSVSEEPQEHDEDHDDHEDEDHDLDETLPALAAPCDRAP
jgi:hypothetical protein